MGGIRSLGVCATTGIVLLAPATAGGADQRVAGRIASQAAIAVSEDGSLVPGAGSTDAVSVRVVMRRGVRVVTVTPRG